MLLTLKFMTFNFVYMLKIIAAIYFKCFHFYARIKSDLYATLYNIKTSLKKQTYQHRPLTTGTRVTGKEAYKPRASC